MITQEKINQNTKKFTDTVQSYSVCDKNLIDKLFELGFFIAPASTMLNLNNAFPGGLVDHSLRVAMYCVKINETLPDELKQSKNSLIRVALLHAIGKSSLYIPCKNDWQIKNMGKMYEFNEELTSMSVGERSIMYIMNHSDNTKLTNDEYQAIINHDKDTDNKSSEWHTETLGVILKMAIKLAIITEKKLKK